MRLRLTALMISLVLLCGCSGSGDGIRERIEALRASVAASTEISFHAALIADDGITSDRYELQCIQKDGTLEIRLLYPKPISGVTARISGENSALHFDGLSFEAGAVDAFGLSPLYAAEIVLSSLRTGVISQMRREKRDNVEMIAFRVLCTEGYDTDIWIDAQTLAPCYAEILSEDRVALHCTISEWSTKEG